VTRLLVDEPESLTGAGLQGYASVDAETADYLPTIEDWPVRRQAVELVRESSERVVSAQLR